jgi:hypothetical protein
VANNGGAADYVTPVLSLAATGSASANCSGPDPAGASLPAGAQQTFTFTCSAGTGSGKLSFTVGITAVDRGSGAGISISPSTSNALTVLSRPPTVTASATSGGTTYASGSWTSDDVVVTFTCTPAVGDPSVKTVTVVSEGAGQTVSSTCTDLAGNQASGSFGGINIDKTPPRISVAATAGGQPYSGSVASQPVTVTFTCSDPGGSGVTQTSLQQVFSNDGLGQSAAGTCIDLAGNSSSATFSPINIAHTPPQLSAVLTAGGAPYAPGAWTNQAVTVNFVCTPAPGAVIAAVSPPVTVSAEGSGQFANGTCTDQAGNRSQVSAGPINLDRTPPVLQLQSISGVNAAGWSNGPVTVTWTCADALSGTATPIVSRTLTASGPATATCSDNAGNTAAATQAGIQIDTAPPFATLISPIAGFTYQVGAQVLANFNCLDGDSGIASCTGTVPNGQLLPLNTPGTYSFTVTAIDVAGNQAQVTHSYTVAAPAPR